MTSFFISPKFVVAATLAVAAFGAPIVAKAARPEIYVSVDFQSGPSWVEPSRGYYVQPAPVYLRPPVLVSPRQVLEQPRFGRYDRRFEWERERAWRHAEWHRHERHEYFRGRGRDRNDHHGRRGSRRD